LRATTFQPPPASLRVTDTAITGSPEPASSRIMLARNRPSSSSTPITERAGPPCVNSRRFAAKYPAPPAVPVQVIVAEVQKHRDVRLQRPRQLRLVGRQLQHDHHPVRRRLQVERPAPDIPPRLHGPPRPAPAHARSAPSWWTSRSTPSRRPPAASCRTRPTRASRKSERTARCRCPPPPRLPGRRDGRMRGRIKMRDPRRHDQRLHPIVSPGPRQVRQRDPFGLGPRPRGLPVVPGHHLRPAGPRSARAVGRPERPSPSTATRWP
jgi:hypothetical protein